MAMHNNDVSFYGKYVGTVLGYNQVSRELDVYIPRLTPTMVGHRKTEKEVATSNITVRGYTDFKPKMKLKNTACVRAEDWSDKMPDIGSKVDISFIERDPRRIIWSHFNMNNDLKFIKEEAYSKLFQINFLNAKAAIHEEDNITVDIDSDVVINRNEKDLSIKIKPLKNYVISNRQPQEPFHGMMWFNTRNNELYIYKSNTFIRYPNSEEFESIKTYIRTQTPTIIRVNSIKDLWGRENETLNNNYFPDDILALKLLNNANDFEPYAIMDSIPNRTRQTGLIYSKSTNKLVNSKIVDNQNVYENLTGFFIVKETTDHKLYLDYIDGMEAWAGSIIAESSSDDQTILDCHFENDVEVIFNHILIEQSQIENALGTFKDKEFEFSIIFDDAVKQDINKGFNQTFKFKYVDGDWTLVGVIESESGNYDYEVFGWLDGDNVKIPVDSRNSKDSFSGVSNFKIKLNCSDEALEKFKECFEYMASEGRHVLK